MKNTESRKKNHNVDAILAKIPVSESAMRIPGNAFRHFLSFVLFVV
jgi:hypothetical protein